MHSVAVGSRRYPCRSHPDPKWWQCAAELQNFENWTCRRFRWLIKPGKKGGLSHCHARGPWRSLQRAKERGFPSSVSKISIPGTFPGTWSWTGWWNNSSVPVQNWLKYPWVVELSFLGRTLVALTRPGGRSGPVGTTPHKPWVFAGRLDFKCWVLHIYVSS